jgi:lysozyme family protein
MAKVELLAPIIFKWEGGFVDDPQDHGGATNMGITLNTWRQCGYDKDGDSDIDVDDLKLLTRDDATKVLKIYYWDRWKADNIINQSIANIVVDWVWGSGKWGIIIPQHILGVVADGIVGPKTIAVLNLAKQDELFAKIFNARVNFLNNIVKNDPDQQRFIDGWVNRLNDFKFST